ncbi:MAG: hypothetical protein RL385_4204, partial [Pseudomonadota bacterium]
MPTFATAKRGGVAAESTLRAPQGKPAAPAVFPGTRTCGLARIACINSRVVGHYGAMATPSPLRLRGALLLALSAPFAACGDDSAAAVDAGSASIATSDASTATTILDASQGASAAGYDSSAPPAPPAPPAALDASVGPRDGAVPAASDAGPSGTSDAGSPGTSDGAVSASACPRCSGPGDYRAGDYPADIHAQEYLTVKGVKGQGSDVRGYKLHIPPSYKPETGMPLVFAIHGLGQNAVMFAVDGAGWPKKSDAAGFILVMPTGNTQNTDGTWNASGSWNAGECCGGAAQAGVDDVELIRAILKDVSAHVNVDLSRVYATGFSNGGFLSFRLACEAADLFAAVAPASGAIGSPDIAPMGVGNSNFTQCSPSAKVSVLAMHGTGDPLVPYGYMKPSLDHIAKANGCSTSTAPAKAPTSAGDTTCVSYSGCPDGIEVTGCTVADGGHCWYGSSSCGFGVDLGTLLG